MIMNPSIITKNQKGIPLLTECPQSSPDKLRHAWNLLPLDKHRDKC